MLLLPVHVKSKKDIYFTALSRSLLLITSAQPLPLPEPKLPAMSRTGCTAALSVAHAWSQGSRDEARANCRPNLHVLNCMGVCGLRVVFPLSFHHFCCQFIIEVLISKVHLLPYI